MQNRDKDHLDSRTAELLEKSRIQGIRPSWPLHDILDLAVLNPFVLMATTNWSIEQVDKFQQDCMALARLGAILRDLAQGMQEIRKRKGREDWGDSFAISSNH